MSKYKVVKTKKDLFYIIDTKASPMSDDSIVFTKSEIRQLVKDIKNLLKDNEQSN